ncbi:Coq4 family protein [Legionella antarctica]|nr:Coq4 family protein [Legionella antarctica]
MLKKLYKNKFFRKILAWRALFYFVEKSPNEINTIKYLYFLSDSNKIRKNKMVSSMKADEHCRALIDGRRRLECFSDTTQLKNCNENTLGFLYAKHLEENNIIEVVPMNQRIFSDYQYIVHPIITTHDIYHVVLGRGVSFNDEGAVAAFTVAQIPHYMPANFHIAAGILRVVCKEDFDLSVSYSVMYDAVMQGRKAKQLFSVNWDEWINTDIMELRAFLNIDRFD